ncbi:unnamed protein product, partial [Notodromas monacha]
MSLTKCHGGWKNEWVYKFKEHGYNGLSNYMRWNKYGKNKNIRVYVLDYSYIKELKNFVTNESPFIDLDSIAPSTGFL